MKFKMILPVMMVMAMLQLLPQAAWSHGGWRNGPYGCGRISPREAHRIWRAEHSAYGYGYGYVPPVYPAYYHRGLLGGLAHAII